MPINYESQLCINRRKCQFLYTEKNVNNLKEIFLLLHLNQLALQINFSARISRALQAKGNLHNMNIFSPSMFRQISFGCELQNKSKAFVKFDLQETEMISA